MGKHTDALGSFENFKAPWETDAGEVEIDKARLKKYLFGVVTDKAKAQDARDESAEAVTKAEQELEEAKSEAAKGDTDGKIAKLEKKLADATTDAKGKQEKLDRLEVALDKGLTVKQAARLSGSTKEELEADADEYLAEVGKPATQETDEEREEREEREAEEAEEAAAGRQSPRLINSADPKLNKDEPVIDFEKIADQVVSRRF